MTLRFRSAISLMAVLLLLVTLIPTRSAQAAPPPLTDAEAISLLRSYAIVRGDPSGNLDLDQRLTRAQAATVFVRSMGAEDYAKLLVNVVPFTDAVGHWAAGEIAMAERLGLMKGDGNGIFRPESDITYAEVLTVLLRMVKQEPAGPWNRETIMATATRVGIAPNGVQGATPAVRGSMFWSLAMAIGRVALPSGKTVLQETIDTLPPRLTLDQTTLAVSESSAVISGTAVGAARVTVAGNAATFNAGTGQFTYTANVAVGTTPLKVEAVDWAGNTATAEVTVQRRSGISQINITGPAAVRAGTSAKLTISAADARGNSVPLDGLKATLSGDVATFNIANATLTAGDKIGRGTLTLETGSVRKTFTFDVTNLSPRASQLTIASINDNRSPSTNQEATVKVQVLDDGGNLVTDDYWRNITLSSTGLSGVHVTPTTASTQAGVATFTIKSTAEGVATLTASSNGFTAESARVEFLSGTRVVLSAVPAKLLPDGTAIAVIRATLQDENGRPVTNTSTSDIQILLNTDGLQGELTDPLISIRKGYSTSNGNDGAFRAGIRPGTAVITGHVEAGQRYSVQSLSLPVTGDLPGAKLQFTYPNTRQSPGATASVTVKVLDSSNRVVTTGSYAFQFTVTTSNGERIVGGLPEGVQLTFPNSTYRPVDDGKASTDALNDANAIVGRTYQGTATINLRYDKSGIVTIAPKLVGPADDAYNNVAGFGPASGSTTMTASAFEVTYAGAANNVSLAVDSTLGKDQPGGAVPPNRTMTVRARVVDANGTPIPGYNGQVALVRTRNGDGVTTIVGSSQKAAVNGVAEFTIQASSTAGFDVYTASSGSLSGGSITVSVRKAVAETPSIAAVRGVSRDDTSPMTGYIAPDDDYMDIQLFPQEPPAGETAYWAYAKVYRKGESTPFFTSGAINLAADPPMIRIPKSSLRAGKYTYEVAINNGAGDTQRSPDLGLSTATNAIYNAAFRVVSGLYDAESGKLVLTTSGLTTGGTFVPGNVSIVKGDDSLNFGSGAVTVSSVTSSSVVLQLGQLASELSPDIFYGTVNIQTTDGWYTNPDGSQIAQGSGTALLKPMATITHGELDPSAKRLYLNGAGFTQGNLSLDLIRIGSVALKPGTSSTNNDRIVATADAMVTISLSQATLDAINALAPADQLITAGMGWLRTGSGASTYKVGAITGANHLLYIRAGIRSVLYDRATNTLTLKGSGYMSATLRPEKLVFRASGRTAEWSPSNAANAQAVDDATITVKFGDTEATQFESTFGGQTVFLNTVSGWLVDAQGRPAAPVPLNSVLFSVPVR